MFLGQVFVIFFFTHPKELGPCRVTWVACVVCEGRHKRLRHKRLFRVPSWGFEENVGVQPAFSSLLSSELIANFVFVLFFL